jgi:hypothetical protein
MASGHVNRTNRPNTWLHRPSLRRDDSPCQPGARKAFSTAVVNHSFMRARCFDVSQGLDPLRGMELAQDAPYGPPGWLLACGPTGTLERRSRAVR